MNEKNILKRQHGLFVSICFVVGFIVGTGIFFLPGRVLYEVGGNMRLGVLAWIIGGLTIATCVYMFSILASKYEHIHGFVDYSEAIVGKRYGYLAGWFFAVMYQPAGYAIIAWITSGFTATLVGITSTNEHYRTFRFSIMAFFMVATFILNYFAPKLPVKLNVGTTVARMLPLILMGTVGVVAGLLMGGGEPVAVTSVAFREANLFAAISAIAFAFNGWQAAVAFNSEVKDSKRNFPIALMGGFGAIIVVYVLYFMGVVWASPDGGVLIMQGGGANFAEGTRQSFANVFGGWASRVLIGFMIISGLGILNACCLGMSRAMYALGRRNTGPMPQRMVELDPATNIPKNSMIMAVCISVAWYAVIFFDTVWIGFRFWLADFYNFSFFAMLVPLFFCFMLRERDNVFKRFVAPIIAIIGASFMFSTYWIGGWLHSVVYTVAFIILAVIGFAFYRSEEPK